jgi:thioredoxin 1
MEQIGGFEQFKQVISTNKYLLLFFTASWCGPCKRIYPQLQELNSKLNKDLIQIYKIQIDDDNNDEICKIFNVESVPSFYLMKDKECINTLKGADIDGIKKMLNIKD